MGWDWRGIVCTGIVALSASKAFCGITLSAVRAALEPKSAPFDSVETFFGWVDRTDSKALDHFTFMRHSLSLQGASPTYPRALVFGERGTFVATFNGSPSQKGYFASELLELHAPGADLRGARTELRELSLVPGTRASLSDANPGKCLTCHFIPARAIWDPYEHWVGAYGTRDDGILDIPNIRFLNLSPTPLERAEYAEELAQYRVFQTIADRHPRYAQLHFPKGSPVSPYSPMHRGEMRFRPNVRLTHDLARHQVSQILSIAAENRDCFAGYKRLLAAALLGCQTVPGFRKDLRTGVSVEFKRFASRFEAWQKQVADRVRSKFPGFSETPWYRADQREPLLENLFPLLGVESVDFGLRKEPRYWDFYEGASYLKDLVGTSLYAALSAEDATLPTPDRIDAYNAAPVTDEARSARYEEAESWWEENPLTLACTTLLDGQDAALPSRAVCEAPPSKAFQRTVVGMCSSCHDGSEKDVPLIPFGLEGIKEARSHWVPRILARLDETDPARRMPPTRPLSRKEIEALRAYLK